MKKKLRYKKFKQLGIPNLFTVGGGFFIIILIGFFVLNYDNYITKYNGYSYQDITKIHSLIEGNETYDFMNRVFLRNKNIKSDSLKFIKLNCFAIKHSSDLKSFINSVNDSLLNKSDKKIMKQQLSNEIYIWDNTKLINTWCLTPRDLDQLKLSDDLDYWIEFRKKFGDYGHHRYSKPIFNKNKNVCIIEHSGQGDWLLGSSEILLFRKINGKWELIKELNLWIS